MELRELKALEIAARSRIVFDGTDWIVPSQSSGKKYRVPIGDTPSCQCEDFQLRRQPCKHILAAQLACERDHSGKAPAIDTDAVPKKPVYRQNWPLYNLAQKTEKHRFLILLHDRCSGIEDPPRAPRPGNKPHLYRDAIFSMVYKVFSTFSSRRFHSDLADAHEKGYLTNPVPGMKVPSFMEESNFTPILHRLIVQSSLPLRAVETAFAPDSTGFSASRHVKWHDEKYGKECSGRDWVKAHAICGVKTNIITAVEIHDRDAADCPPFKPLVERTAENFTVKEVPADKAYLSHDNFALVEKLGGTAYIPFKSNSVPGEPGSLWAKMYFFYQFNRETFLKHYHQRSNAESTFSMVKAKFGDAVRSKTDVAMKNETLCKLLAHNSIVVHQSHIELGIEPIFWADKPVDSLAVIPFARPS